MGSLGWWRLASRLTGTGELLKPQRPITGETARAVPRGPGEGETTTVGTLGAVFARVAEDLALVPFFLERNRMVEFSFNDL